MNNYKKINPNNLLPKQAQEDLDTYRADRSPDLDPLKVAYTLNAVVRNFNLLVDDYEQMKALVIKMRDRKKPGPKPKKAK